MDIVVSLPTSEHSDFSLTGSIAALTTVGYQPININSIIPTGKNHIRSVRRCDFEICVMRWSSCVAAFVGVNCRAAY